MKNFLKHAGLMLGGFVAVGIAIICPPVAPILGPWGTKLIIAGGGSLALATASPEAVRSIVGLVKK